MTSKMARRDIGENIIEIKHNTGTDKWLVTKKLLDASKISPKVSLLLPTDHVVEFAGNCSQIFKPPTDLADNSSLG